MQQGLTTDYINRVHDEFSKEQATLVDEMKRSTTVEKEKTFTRQISMLNQLLMLLLKFRNLKRQLELRKTNFAIAKTWVRNCEQLATPFAQN